MGLFKRAGWHSGLTYRRVCDQCKTTVEYMDDKLDFRPWFADGFVYCPTCQKPLRHNECYAIDSPTVGATVAIGAAAQNQNTAAKQPIAEEGAPSAVEGAPSAAVGGELPAFCNQCGRRYAEGDRFCPHCGNKRG